MKDCIFCKIIGEQLPSMKVFEDKNTFAFMDIAKDVDGHILVVPRRHFKNILDCDSITLGNVMETVKRISNHLTDNCGYDGVNLLNASEESAGQSVPHFHIHIIPRKKGDGIDAWPAFKGAKSGIEDIYNKIVMDAELSCVIPELKDLWFRQSLLSDKETMSYNNAYGGTIDFPEGAWRDWYDRWIVNHENKRFYRYLKDEKRGFVGEIAYHLDEQTHKYIADIIIKAEYRGSGLGDRGLKLLCRLAKANGLDMLYDDIAADNPAAALFLKNGFEEEYRTDKIVMLKKKL